MARSNGGAVALDEGESTERAGDQRAAFAAIYDQHFRRVYTYVRYRIRDAAAADDLTAQVFERALARFEHFDPERGDIGGWLFGIARNAVSDHRRAQMRWRFLPLATIWRRPSPAGPVDQDLIADEARGRLMAALAHLDDRERDLLGLKFAGGLGNQAIAKLTGLTASHVGVLLYRAVRKLRSRLEE